MKDKMKLWLVAVSCLAAVFLLSAALIWIFAPGAHTGGAVLRVSGDVRSALSIEDDGAFNKESFTYKGSALSGIPLKDILKKASPYPGLYDILFIAGDGLAAGIPGDDIEGCYIRPDGGGWEAVNTRHPVSSNMKGVARIVVASREVMPENSLNIISAERELFYFSPGNLEKAGYTVEYRPGGTSYMISGGKELTATQYRQQKTVALKSLEPEIGETIANVFVAGDNGGYAFDSAPGSILIEENSLTYLFSDGKTEMKQARGVMINPPEKRIADACTDALSMLRQNEKVLLLILDGFSYGQYVKAGEDGFAPYIGSLPPAVKAASVFIPVTHAGVSAILTGKGPDENGVSFRQKELKTGDIFRMAKAMGKTAAYIEGDARIVNTSLSPALNPDGNGDGSTDDEIYASAMQAVSDKPDLLVVHFHAIDDYGHKYGPYSQKTMQAISRVDGYVQGLMEAFGGRTVLVADHGMHEEGGRGAHGQFIHQDMVVPYIVK